MFVNSLIPMGISVFHSDNVEDLVDKLSNRPIEVVVFDVIQENYDEAFKVLAGMKNNSSEKISKIAIVMLIGGVDKKQIARALQLGALGFIKSNASGETIAKYIIDLYEKKQGAPPQRKFVRVTLDATIESERIGVKFRSPRNMQLILGVLCDISSGGIAVELVGTFPPEAIEQGMEIKNMQFILEGRDVLVDAVVVAYQKKFCAFRFTNVSEQDKEAISQFIFEKIS
jgi:DNA-binding NarL/FixJ family response regulator